MDRLEELAFYMNNSGPIFLKPARRIDKNGSQKDFQVPRN
jgi:hypothetical protein